MQTYLFWWVFFWGWGEREGLGGMRKEDWRERLHFALGSVYSTLGNLRDLVEVLKSCLVNSWKLNLRENQALCVPLNGSHPSIILFRVWFVLSIPSSCCSCLLCVPSDSLLMSSHLAHFLCPVWFSLEHQPFPIICQYLYLCGLSSIHRPSFPCSPYLLGCSELWTHILHLLHSPGSTVASSQAFMQLFLVCMSHIFGFVAFCSCKSNRLRVWNDYFCQIWRSSSLWPV